MSCINCGSGKPTEDLGELSTKIRNKLKQNYEEEKMSTEYEEDCNCMGCAIRRSYESMQEEFRKNLEAMSKEETENSIEEILKQLNSGILKEGGFKRGEAFVVVSETDSSKSQLGEVEEPTFSDSIEELIEEEVSRRVKERMAKIIEAIK